MNVPQRVLAVLPCIVVLACFEDPNPPAVMVTTETTGNDVGDGDPGDGDGDPGDGDPGDGDPGSSPSFVSFTIYGSTMPTLVEAASAVVVEAEVEDPDDDISYLVFKRDGETISTQSDTGPSYSFEWVVSGAELNGDYSFVAEIYDSDDNMATSDPISLTLGMPQSGEVDDWFHDSGELDALYGLWVDAEGAAVVLTGQTSVNLTSEARTDRVVGALWGDKIDSTSVYGAAVTPRDAGGFFVVGGAVTQNNSINSTLLHYDDAGALVERDEFNATSQVADDLDNAIAAGRAPGGLWIMGSYNPTGGPTQGEWSTYLRRYTDGLDLEYSRFPSETLAGQVFAYDMSVASDGRLALAGGQFSTNPVRPWFARFDETGVLIDETQVDDVDGGVLHAVALTDDGSVVIGGQATLNAMTMSWVRSYDSNGDQVFDVQIPNTALGVVAAVASDPWGEVIAVATENCTLDGFRYVDCDLVIRKFAPDGTQMWEEQYPDSFLGPQLSLLGFDASVALDRYGYVYVTAIPLDQTGTDWWARKLHP